MEESVSNEVSPTTRIYINDLLGVQKEDECIETCTFNGDVEVIYRSTEQLWKKKRRPLMMMKVHIYTEQEQLIARYISAYGIDAQGGIEEKYMGIRADQRDIHTENQRDARQTVITDFFMK